MAEDIILRYRAETDELTKEINLIIEQQEKIEESTKQTADNAKKSSAVEIAAAKARQTLIEKELANIKALEVARKRSADPKLIEKYNKALAESERNIRSLKSATEQTGKSIEKSFDSAGSSIKNLGTSIASALGIAFSVDALIGFSRASVNAFLDAEKNAQRLKFSITEVGNEGVEVFDRLIRQSERFEGIFSDDDIQKAQVALSNFGLIGDEIEAGIPLILDYAAATGQDLASAISQVGAGLEGAGREFKKYQIEVSATASRQENYNSLLQGFVQFQGAANDQLNTTAGRLEALKNRFDNFQEDVGEFLVNFGINLKNSLIDLGEGITIFLGKLGFNVEVKKELDKSVDAFDDFRNQVSASLQASVDIEDFEKRAKEFSDAATIGIDKSLQVIQRLERALDQARNRAVVNQDEIFAINTAIEKERQTNLQNEQLRLQQIDATTTALRETMFKKQTEIDKRNLKELAKQIEARLLLSKKGSDEELSLAIRLSRLKAEIEINDLEKENDTEATRALIRAKARRAEKDLREAFFKDATADLNAFLDAEEAALKDAEAKRKELKRVLTEGQEIDIKLNVNTENVGEFRDVLFELYQEELRNIERTAKTTEEANARKLKAYEDYVAKAEKVLGGHFKKEEDKNNESVTDWVTKNEQRLQSSLNLIAQLNELNSRFSDERIASLEAQKERNDEQLSEEERLLQDSLDKRIISEGEYEKKSEALRLKRVENEKKLQAAINKEKRKQALLDRINAVFEITINTAIAATKALATPPAPNVVLAALAGALGAAQLATALAAPIPAYAKGTKKAKGGMSLVGEQGAEVMYVPKDAKILPAQKTKNYGEVLDAMYDNRFDRFILDRYTAPALAEQKKRYENKQQETFASNIVNSMTVNGLTLGDVMYANKKGVTIRGQEEFAEILASKIAGKLPTIDLRRI